MAVYLNIRRVSNNPATAEYAFGPSEQRLGKLKLDKATGDVVLLEAIPGDDHEALFQRAAHKIKKHWAAGQVPEETCWAS